MSTATVPYSGMKIPREASSTKGLNTWYPLRCSAAIGDNTSSPTTGASRPSSGSRRLRVAVMLLASSGSPRCRTVATGFRAADRPSGSPTPTKVAASGAEVDQGWVVGGRGALSSGRCGWG